MRYQVGFVPCRLDVWQCRKCKSASKWNLWCFHLIHLHNVYGVIHIKSALRLYTNALLPVFPCLTFPLQTLWSLVFLLGPRQSSYIYCHLWHKSNAGVFIHLHVLNLTTSCSLAALTSLTLTRSEGIPHCRWSLTGMRERVRERLRRGLTE